MALGKGIPVINGFDLNSKLPLDSRAVVDTMEDMNALITNGSVGDGQLCYCKADKKLYVLKDNVWGEVGGGGSGIPVVEGTESATITDGAYATYTIPEAQTSCFIFKCDLGIAFVSYNAAFQTYNGYLDAEGEVTDGSLKLNNLIVLSGSGTDIDIFFGNIVSSGGGGGGEGITPKPITSTADYASLTDTDYFISVNITEDSSAAKKGTYILSGNKANGYSYWYPENKSEGLNMQVYWHYIHYDSTGLSAVGFNSYLDIGNNNQSGFGFEGSVHGSNVFGGFTVEQVPLFSKYKLVTNAVDPVPILPCTTSDNGKVLSVVNGEAQWASASGQKVYTCAITDLLSISDIQNLIGVITSSQYSTAKRYNLLKSIDDIINEYDYIYVDTSALQMPGGLTFRKQINAGTNKNFSLCYGYFNFDSPSNKMGSFANIVISLSDAWYVETISSLTLLPNVDGTSTNNGKVLTFDTNSLSTNGVPYKWASAGGSGSISVTFED